MTLHNIILDLEEFFLILYPHRLCIHNCVVVLWSTLSKAVAHIKSVHAGYSCDLWLSIGLCRQNRNQLQNILPCHKVDIFIHMCRNWMKINTGQHFTNTFSITIQISWKFVCTVIQLLVRISLQIFAHDTTAQLSCHVQNFVVIILLEFGWEQNEISREFELWC